MDDVQNSGWRPAYPVDVGIDPEKLADAVAFAEAAETRWPRNLSGGLARLEKTTEPPPWNETLGPKKNRGGPNGLILKDGVYILKISVITKKTMNIILKFNMKSTVPFV